MPHAKEMRFSHLKELAGNHAKNQDLPFLSETAIISLEELQSYVEQIKTQGNAIQIIFVRYPVTEANKENERLSMADRNLSQVSLVFAPARIVQGHPQWIVETAKDGDSVLTLPVCDPDDLNDTGLCPPKGNCLGENTQL